MHSYLNGIVAFRGFAAFAGVLACSQIALADADFGAMETNPSGVEVSAEFLLLTYDRDQGLRVGAFDTERVAEEENPAFRAQIAIPVLYDDIYFRMRGFLFDQGPLVAVSGRSAETFRVELVSADAEVAYTARFADWLELDLSAGVRKANFLEVMIDDFDQREHEFQAIGPLVGIEARLKLIDTASHRLSAFVRARAAFMEASGSRFNDTSGVQSIDGRDTNQFEFAGGVEIASKPANGVSVFARLFGEYQLLQAHTSDFPPSAIPNFLDENRWSQQADAVLYGGGLVVGIRW